jgi:hypothetical protein
MSHLHAQESPIVRLPVDAQQDEYSVTQVRLSLASRELRWHCEHALSHSPDEASHTVESAQ